MTKDVVWLTHEPMEFLMRRGDHFDDEPERYERMYSRENLKRMAAAGVRFGRLYFYKGFGLNYERPNIDKSIRAAQIMHELGMKVAVYFAGTMFTETFYREVPEAKGWEQRDQNDRWVPYGSSTYRHFACPNEPKYRNYLKRVLKIAIEEVRADEVSFDNLSLAAEPKSCRCPRCIQGFHAFLKARYPNEASARRRFGVPDTDWLNVNEWDVAASPDRLSELNDPVLQEWVRFRCESLANHTKDLASYVKSLNPNTAIHFNIKGVYSYNRYWTNAVYHPLFTGQMDEISFDTGGYDARIDKNTGALVSQIRSYKVARRLKASCEETVEDELRAAVHLAFGHQTTVKGHPGAPWKTGALHAFTPVLEFFREYNDRYYRETELVADVAVLRNWPSMAYSISGTYVPTTLVEQVLIQHKVPFDLLFDEQLAGSAHRYKALILAGQECVSNAQVAFLLAYARKGGTLILAGDIARYNEWREKRRTNPFPAAGPLGNGKIVYIPRITAATPRQTAEESADPEPGASQRRGVNMSPPQWVLPRNHEEIHRAIVDNIPNGISITTEAPLTTVMELLTRPKTRETLLHFVNFDRQRSTAPFKVAVRKQFAGPVKSVQCFSPDQSEPSTLKFQETGEQVEFVVPQTRLYSMIVLSS